jgi:hypothetical protein
MHESLRFTRFTNCFQKEKSVNHVYRSCRLSRGGDAPVHRGPGGGMGSAPPRRSTRDRFQARSHDVMRRKRGPRDSSPQACLGGGAT